MAQSRRRGSVETENWMYRPGCGGQPAEMKAERMLLSQKQVQTDVAAQRLGVAAGFVLLCERGVRAVRGPIGFRRQPEFSTFPDQLPHTSQQ